MAVGKSGVIQHTLYNDYYISQHGYSYVDVYWEEEYDVATNSSVIKVTQITFRHSKYGGSWSVYGTVTIDGTAYSFGSTIGSGGAIANPITSNPIYHDDASGAKTITISTACNTVGGSGGTQLYDSNHGKASVTVALTTIPRLSEISASNGTLGVAQTLSVTQKSASYTHTIVWSSGSASGTICTKSNVLSFSWTPSVDLASQNTTGASVSVAFTITTYSGDTSIGSKTQTVAYAIPDSVVPSVTMTITDANGYADKYGGYVQSRSKLKVVLDVATAYGSEIAVNTVSVEGTTYYGESIETAIINGSGAVSVKATVTDKRGRIGTATVDVDVLPYTQPAILGVTYNRADADGTDNVMGEYAEVVMNASVTALGGNNSATYRLQYKKLSDSTYTNFDMSEYQNVYSLEDVAAIFAAAADYSYNIVFTVSDDFSEKFGFAKTEFVLQTGKVLMHRRAKGNGMGLGRICEDDDLLDIDWNIRGRKDMQIDGALSVGDKATTLSNIGAVSKSGDTIHGSLSVDNRVSADNFHSNYIELGSNLISGTNFGGFIDFHYEGNPVDYTSRIIEDVEGSLNLQTPNGLRVNNNALADFVIAQGSSGGWHYRKWNSGNAEIWRRDAYSVTMPYGSKGCAVDYPVNYAFPFTFTSITNANAIPDNQNLQQWIGTMTFTTSSISRVCFDSFYDVASTGYLSIRIEGKWK